MSTVVLDLVKVGVASAISRSVAERLTVEEITDHTADTLVTRLTGFVLASRLDDTSTHEAQVPATWWQHWKHANAPGWWLRRRPVRYVTTTLRADFTQHTTFPRADIPLPADRFGYPVTVQALRTSLWSDGLDPVEWAEQPAPPRPFIPRTELVYRIHWASRDNPNGGPPIDFRQADAVLDALAGMGVNPNELVREAA